MPLPLTTNQLRQLGILLRDSRVPDPADLESLDEYERSFEEAQVEMVRMIREAVGVSPSVRPLKTVTSIIAKLRRGIDLHVMQDIAGCRIVVDDVTLQDDMVDRLSELSWDNCRLVDRRKHPSHGYRAVHLIVRTRGRRLEIQVRSRVQDGWAQLSEKLADMYGLDVKYGGGPSKVREILERVSRATAVLEELHVRLDALRLRPYSEDFEMELSALEDEMAQELSSQKLTQYEAEVSVLLRQFPAEPS